jgi:serine/threonine-protein kinase RsbT
MTATAPSATAEELVIAGDEDVVRTRQVVRRWAEAAALPLVDQTKLVTATSELARNALVHGGGGRARIEQTRLAGRTGIRVTISDEGGGIPDVELAFRDGYTTRGGLGLGLGGARRLVDEFELTTQVGAGTSIVVTTWTRCRRRAVT